MDADAERMALLKDFDLPVYAMRAYLALLQLGTAEARHVSELGRIPVAKVYTTLDQLQARGLLTVTPGKPRKYSPVAMADFLERRLQAHREQAEELAAQKDRLADLFPIVGTVELGERASVHTLRGRRNIGQHFRENAAAARHEIDVLLPSAPQGKLPAIAKTLMDARARGVQVRVLARPPVVPADDPFRDLDALPGAVRVSHDAKLEPDVALATFDGGTALLAHFVPAQSGRGHAKDVAVLTRETALVKTLAGMLHLSWLQAEVGEAASPAAELPGLLRGHRQPIVVTDARGRVTLWSQGAESAFGILESRAVGLGLSAVLPTLEGVESSGEARVRIGGRPFLVTSDCAQNGGGSRMWSFHPEGAAPPLSARPSFPPR